MDTILRIHANEEKLYPPRKGLEHTDIKLKALLRTHENLDVAALFMIALIVLIVLRILYDVLARFPSLPDWGIELLLPLVDLVIMVWLFLLFFVLGFVHVFARRHESSVRKKTDEYLATRSDEPETLNRVSNTASTKPALGQRRMHPFVVWGAVLLLASLFDQGRKRAP